ncbi:MAG: decarboxylating NADP(+)-dependent phosphogluconate dehydrogenase [Spirochaetota bacterium]
MNLKADIGLMGLAVMGRNLVLNIADKGFTVAVYNRTTEKTEEFINEISESYTSILPAYTIEEFVDSLSRPRKIILMVKAGNAVDIVIDTIIPFLDEGDIIIDGGNSNFRDTARRTDELAGKGLLYTGSGISGGEEGARFGPSIMPGGNTAAWQHIKDIFQSIAAQNSDGTSCCEWIGEGGAGHFVKMVHNGIEYGDMQIISESYDIMHSGMGLTHDELFTIYGNWHGTELESYLIEITRDIMACRDDDGEILLTKIRDAAQQKGTGKWTGISAYELDTPVTLISEAVFARLLSSGRQMREEASKILTGPVPSGMDRSPEAVERLRKALLAAKVISYAQGFLLLKQAAQEYGWDLDYAVIARIWRNGCIIKSVFLDKISAAFQNDTALSNLLFDPYFSKIMNSCEQAMRETVSDAARIGIPLPALSSALAYYDGLRSRSLPANLIQAQRDYFGAHLYERTDRPEGEFYHTEWKKFQQD